MNIVWTLCMIILAVWEGNIGKTGIYKNLKYINQHELQIQSTVKSTSQKPLRYTSEELKRINSDLRSENRRNIPNYGTIRQVKLLKINRKRIRFQKLKLLSIRRVNLQNLKQLDKHESSPNHNKYIRIGTVNVRSIKNKVNQLVELILSHSLDLLVVTETWLRNTDHDDYWLKQQDFIKINFKVHNVPRPTEQRGGGILLIYKTNFKLLSSEEQCIKFAESCLWSIAINNKITLTCLGIYHPPVTAQDQVTDSIFIDNLLDSITAIMSNHKNIIICGDLNLHVNDISNNDTIIFNDAMSSLGFTQHVNTATHCNGNTLDLIITEDIADFSVRNCVVSDFISDHRIVFCECNIMKPTTPFGKIKIRKKNDDLKQIFQDQFQEHALLEIDNVPQLVENLNCELRRVYDIAMPEKEISSKIRPPMKWFDHEAKQQKIIVRNRERTWLKYGENHQWLAYKRERNRYRNIITYKRQQEYSGLVLKSKGNSKELYKTVNFLSNISNPNVLPETDSDSNLAEEFASFFLNKIEKIRELFINTPAYAPPINEYVPIFRSFSPLTNTEVTSIIMSLKSKSCELDSIPTSVLKEILPSCINTITKLVNLSLSEGIFAEDWKCAIVRPLLKKLGLDLILKNYRPVSNLSFLSKVVERAALNQFNTHCETYELIPDYQSAYREGYSCESCVLKLFNDLLWAMEDRKVTISVFLDLSAAFDTVDHDLLLEILNKQFGISDSALQWYQSYLRPRGFKVCINDKFSSTKTLAFSVPQGSASGANIFTAYCSTLKSVLPTEIELQGFADDHFMHKAVNPKSQNACEAAISQFEESINNVKLWMDSMRLKMNTDKTEYIIFHGSRISINNIPDTITAITDPVQ